MENAGLRRRLAAQEARAVQKLRPKRPRQKVLQWWAHLSGWERSIIVVPAVLLTGLTLGWAIGTTVIWMASPPVINDPTTLGSFSGGGCHGNLYQERYQDFCFYEITCDHDSWLDGRDGYPLPAHLPHFEAIPCATLPRPILPTVMPVGGTAVPLHLHLDRVFWTPMVYRWPS